MTNNLENVTITNTILEDYEKVLWLFDQVMVLQGTNGYKVWETIDKESLITEIKNKQQFKIVEDSEILCLFSIQLNDPFIWREKDQNDAIYLHRIAVNPNFKGKKTFQKVLAWAMQFANQNNLKFIRMDTWSDNFKLIDYYKSFGFQFIENYKTSSDSSLPLQNRNLEVALLQLEVKKNVQ